MFKIIAFINSAIYPVLAIALIPSTLYAFYLKDYRFANSLLALLTITLLLTFVVRKKIVPSKQLTTIQGFAAVGISWIFISLFGTLPYIFSNSNLSYIDILFETISGFTTTGASILTDIESINPALLLWRSITQWLGGMGIVVLTISILPLLGSGGNNLFKAESTAPTTYTLTTKFKDTA